jgi:selenocysteine lyase/cysteine desulfurase
MPGVVLSRPFDADRISGIVTFKMPQADQPAIYRELLKRGLVCALRGGGIRLSPHFYQAGEPVKTMLELIDEVTKLN